MIIFILIISLTIISFTIGFNIGRFKGAKEGIDYCFERRKEELEESKG